MKKSDLPSIDEVLCALYESPLGEGAEAAVYKIHTSPDFTVRKSLSGVSMDAMAKYLEESELIMQPEIFGKRNFAQSVAYFKHPKDNIAMNGLNLSINRYCPGFSYEVHKAGRVKPSSEEALMRTRLMSEKILEVPDSALDMIYDDLHFLSSRRHSIDVGSALYTNMGNILYSAVDKRLFIIDLQEFITQRPGISPNHTKGFNTPLFLTKGLLPGAYCYKDEHADDPKLIKYRTQIVDRVISAAQRNNLNDVGGYLSGDADRMKIFWDLQLKIIRVPEKYQGNMIKRVTSIQDERRYPKEKANNAYIRVSGRTDY